MLRGAIILKAALSETARILIKPWNYSSYYSLMSIIAEGVQQSLIADNNYTVEYDIENGTCYLWCCWGISSYCLGLLCYPCARKMITSQQVTFEDKRLNYKFDSWFFRVDKMVPYDRIQDVDITENCIQRCFGVHSVSIQTAGSGPPEVTVIAPKNPSVLRDHIIARRDLIVHGNETSLNAQPNDGIGMSAVRSPLLGNTPQTQELVEISRTLLRIESLLQSGISKMEEK